MVLNMREFDFAHELAMYAGVGASLLAVIGATGAVVVLIRYLLTKVRHRRLTRP